MIIWIFLTFLALALILLTLGLWIEDSTLQVIAFGLLWLPAFALSGIDAPLINDTPGIQYPHGYNITENIYETYQYGDNYSGYHWDYMNDPPTCTLPNAIECVNLFHVNNTITTNKTPNTQTYSNRLYGILLIFVTVFGMILSLGEMRGVTESDGPKGINWRRFR